MSSFFILFSRSVIKPMN